MWPGSQVFLNTNFDISSSLEASIAENFTDEKQVRNLYNTCWGLKDAVRECIRNLRPIREIQINMLDILFEAAIGNLCTKSAPLI